jgi:hypothetical protein
MVESGSHERNTDTVLDKGESDTKVRRQEIADVSQRRQVMKFDPERMQKWYRNHKNKLST